MSAPNADFLVLARVHSAPGPNISILTVFHFPAIINRLSVSCQCGNKMCYFGGLKSNTQRTSSDKAYIFPS